MFGRWYRARYSCRVSFCCVLFGDQTRHLAVAAVPVLKSCLSDDDAATRHITCLALSRLFKGLPLYFDFMGVRDLYPELMKRLDDSSDQVRLASMVMLKSFAGTCPVEELRGGPVEHVVDALLVHLDDLDPQIQVTAACRVSCDDYWRCLAVVVERRRSWQDSSLLVSLLGPQEAALGALVVFGKLDLRYIRNQILEQKTKQRTTEYLDRLSAALDA